MGNFMKVANGRERWNAGVHIPRHRHDQAYAAIVLSGSYEECGNRGRFNVCAGDVVLHTAFDAHLDRFKNTDVQILNLVVDGWPRSHSAGHVADPDAIARAAERNPHDAAMQLRAQLKPSPRVAPDWQDILAFDLLDDPDCRLDDWARRHHLAAETISRGFGKVFGVTPASFRLEARAHRAFALIRETALSLAAIAARTGFADQAHMSRAVRALTTAAPSDWRKSNSFKTGRTIAA